MIANLPFSDIYLKKESGILSGVNLKQNPMAIPSEFSSWVSDTFKMCSERRKATGKGEFNLKTDEMVFRVSFMATVDGDVFVLRRLPNKVPSLYQLGINRLYADKMNAADTNGLIVISGAFGSGKTTTASSLIKARLETYGGICVSIEDPPEMPLEGSHGDGVCFQTPVSDSGFAESTRQAARWAPDIIYIGEVRDGDTAIEALKASINGKLIICTVHSDSPSLAAERLFMLAKSGGGDSDDISGLMANGTACFYHQELKRSESRTIPVVQFLWVKDITDARENIRKRKFKALDSEIQRQRNFMIHRGKL
jgi:twitching motility protein PilT